MRRSLQIVVAFILATLFALGTASHAHAATAAPTPVVAVATPSAAASATASAGVVAPDGPTAPATPTKPASSSGDGSVTVDVGGKPSTSVSILLLLTVVSVAPSLLLLMTSFTKIFVVLSITRNALGLTSVPPNQVLAGLSLFISGFVMAPVFSKVNSQGIQPYLSRQEDPDRRPSTTASRRCRRSCCSTPDRRRSR